MMRDYTETIFRVLTMFINASSIYQARHLHNEEIDIQRKLNAESIEKSRQWHRQSIELNKKTYLVDMFLSLEQHFQQLNSDLIGKPRHPCVVDVV